MPDTHQCEENVSNVKSQGLVETHGLVKIKRCIMVDCRNPSLDAYDSSEFLIICQGCRGSYCAYHRYPETHGCNGQQDNIDTRPVSSTRMRQGGKPPSDPTRLGKYQKAEAIKMRHRAFPGDPKDQAVSVPLQERIHIKVSVGENEKVLWFRKTLIAGRVLDLLASLLNLPSVGTQLVYLKENERIFIRNDCLLADQVEDGCILMLDP
ncbi:hypothetical protein BDQ17DRAFT_1357987 [Cyathus striatus]|nr:hypothetical protein BDQ17DRAFT_1357987 [Cyathus striatus]